MKHHEILPYPYCDYPAPLPTWKAVLYVGIVLGLILLSGLQ